jgi:hypothetical protein
MVFGPRIIDSPPEIGQVAWRINWGRLAYSWAGWRKIVLEQNRTGHLIDRYGY